MESSSDEEESGLQDEKTSGSVVDMEDLGNIMNSVKRAKVRLCTHLVTETLIFQYTTQAYIDSLVAQLTGVI